MSLFYLLIIPLFLRKFSYQLPCLSPRSVFASASWDKTIKLWDLDEKSQCIKTLVGHTDVISEVAFYPNFTYLVSCSWDKSLRVWNVATGLGIIVLNKHESAIITVDVSSDGKWIASADYGGIIQIWSAINFSYVGKITASGYVFRLKFSADSKKIYCGLLSGIVEIFDVETRALLISLKINSKHTTALTLTSDLKYLITGSEDFLIKVVDLGDFKEVNTLSGHENIVIGVSVNSDNSLLVSCGADKNIIIWDLKAGKSINTLKGHSGAVKTVKFTIDSKYLISGSDDSTIKIWDISTGNCIKSFQSHNSTVEDLKIIYNCVGKSDSNGKEAYCDCGSQLFLTDPDLGVCDKIELNGCKECQCPLGYFPLNNTCRACPLGCKTCKALNVCDVCNKNLYRLYTETTKYAECLTCLQLGEYVDQASPVSDGTGICLWHSNCKILNCDKCSNLYQKCSACAQGFYLDAIENAGCISCTQKGRLISGANCLVCTENCEQCSSQTFCKKCAEGYFLLSKREGDIIEQSCSTCKNSEEYIDEMYSATDGTGLCLKALYCTHVNCKKCFDNYNKCSTCLENFYFNPNSAISCTDCTQKGYFIKGSLCLACVENCDKCHKESQCDRCVPNLYLTYFKNDTSSCTECKTPGSYIDTYSPSLDGSGLCLQYSNCSFFNCKKCTKNDTQCLLCVARYYLKETVQEQSCTRCEEKGYFIQDSKCLPCLENCDICKTTDTCEHCKLGLYLQLSKKNTIYEKCKICNELGEYIDKNYPQADGSGLCLSKSDCSIISCQICANKYSECSVCEKNYYLNSTDQNRSCTDCPAFGNFIQGLSCLTCVENCENCKSQNVCEKCEAGYFLEFHLSNMAKRSCDLCNIPGKYVDEENKSLDGYGYCLDHSECPITNCKKCQSKYKKCSLCQESYYLNSSTDNSSCTACSQRGYSIQGSICFKCPQNCEACLSDNNCTKCELELNLYSGKCSLCFPNCEECLSAKNCTVCAKSFYLFSSSQNSGIYDICIDSCEQSRGLIQAENARVCMNCSLLMPNCLYCESGSNCLECNQGYFLKSTKNVDIYDSCIATCAENYAIKEIVGRKSLACEICSLSKNHILLPPLHEVCRSCDSLVKGCSRCFRSDKCEECLTDYIFFNSICIPLCSTGALNIVDLTELKCISDCEPGFFKFYEEILKINTCKQCPSECEACRDQNECIVCKLGYFLEKKKCQRTCSPKTFPNLAERICSECKNEEFPFLDETGIKCVRCRSPCKSCNHDPSNCTSCESSLFWNGVNCVTSCEEGKYQIQEFGICAKCHFSCRTCDNGESFACTSCSKDLYLHKGTCVKNCPENYFENQASRSCDLCHFSCLKCTGSSANDCFGCPLSRTLLQLRISSNNELSLGTCLCKPKFFEKEEMQCGECHYSCANCTGVSHMACTVCAANRGDINRAPVNGRCTCPAKTFDYLEEECRDNSELSTTISLVSSQEESVKYTTITSIIGFGFLRVFGSLFNFIDEAQEINLYSFLSIGYPLNLEGLLDFLATFRFYKNFKFFEIEKNNHSFESNSTEPKRNFQAKGISIFFLKNCLSTLIIIFGTPLIFYFFLKLLGFYFEKSGKRSNRKSLVGQLFFVVWEYRRVMSMRLIFLLFMGSLQEVNLFAIIQISNNDPRSLFGKINFAVSIMWIFLEGLVLLYVGIAFFKSNPGIVPERLLTGLAKIFKTTLVTASKPNNHDVYPFLFSKLQKDDKSGMSFIFYKLIKKVLLPIIYALFSEDIETATTSLLIAYSFFYMYIRTIQPFKYTIFNITNELIELGHLCFFCCLKFYSRAVMLKNSRIALDLGLFMIFAVIFIIMVNTLFMGLSFLYILDEKFRELKERRRKKKFKILEEEKSNSATARKTVPGDNLQGVKDIPIELVKYDTVNIRHEITHLQLALNTPQSTEKESYQDEKILYKAKTLDKPEESAVNEIELIKNNTGLNINESSKKLHNIQTFQGGGSPKEELIDRRYSGSNQIKSFTSDLNEENSSEFEKTYSEMVLDFNKISEKFSVANPLKINLN